MPITLSVYMYRNAAPAQALTRRFDQLGGAIGRAPGNDLVLDDPGKYISRLHARVEYRDDAFWLVDVGSNPSLVNDRPVGTGRSVQLEDGDRVTIGDYQLLASVESEATAFMPAAAPQPVPPSPLQVAPPPPPVTPDLPMNPDDSLANAGILDVGGDPLNPSFDPLGLNLFGSPAPAPAPAPSVPAWRGAESDHVPPEQLPFAAPPAPAPMPSFAAPHPQPAAAMAIPDDYDPLADFLPPRVQAAPAPAPVPAPLPVDQAEATAFAPSAPPVMPVPAAPPPPPPPPVQAAPRAPGTAAADDPVIQALMRGLGLSELNTKRSAEEIAELAGAMLREATTGTMGVLMGRAMTKRESRLDMTMISAAANNPLKFFPDADSALTQMINGTMPGYMQPARAFANAFDDLKAHELAIMAGMRAALEGVLARFDPAAIEARLQVPTVMDKMLAANRKAKMWDRMVELYTQMASEADSDFHRLFGEAFGKAYEEQIARLRQARR
ncbi:type VI secretion system-associated FHA domain protein TagH [Telluria mixta]|uniref:Type VI secretion system-associated FHA domain protein TagH n=1 Tax=Telluria mixta TaxID=34071 RepID=A0ABT2BUQ8_9BURK|nr:type VI secretion system-associated FHA domain protein TagH [Telluria mixta]MCS0628860.1 type VI secretion system-associated FHA domain protein TagH [Telluria mixta]WEM97315.1 type VI secretion system-associated FHA domain protein TagH [Telluria mixta]